MAPVVLGDELLDRRSAGRKPRVAVNEYDGVILAQRRGNRRQLAVGRVAATECWMLRVA